MQLLDERRAKSLNDAVGKSGAPIISTAPQYARGKLQKHTSLWLSKHFLKSALIRSKPAQMSVCRVGTFTSSPRTTFISPTLAAT